MREVSQVTKNEFLTFRTGVGHYGIDIRKVTHIRGHDALEPAAYATQWVAGHLDVRGIRVPVFDLRRKLDPGRPSDGNAAAVIVLNLPDRLVGIAVDHVLGVQTVAADEIRPAHGREDRLGSCALADEATPCTRELVLLDIERVMNDADMGGMGEPIA